MPGRRGNRGRQPKWQRPGWGVAGTAVWTGEEPAQTAPPATAWDGALPPVPWEAPVREHVAAPAEEKQKAKKKKGKQIASAQAPAAATSSGKSREERREERRLAAGQAKTEELEGMEGMGEAKERMAALCRDADPQTLAMLRAFMAVNGNDVVKHAYDSIVGKK
ncbi:hypothetical protein B9Z65_2272 [Elsinoe australis]|uniref:Uncharacterized protein n=1 Tax=Elsinoe australis TaxID=40998 RepID=A0A2P7ZA88_9PEZI|nr:hypothetical protein B9Z65_2272 [Elsinoe australis]